MDGVWITSSGKTIIDRAKPQATRVILRLIHQINNSSRLKPTYFLVGKDRHFPSRPQMDCRSGPAAVSWS